MLKRWLHEPLIHFLLLGALIFIAYQALAPEQGRDDDTRIVVTQGQQEHLVTAFSRTWQRPPTPEEFNGLVDDWIREEIAYREGLAMGLDSGDLIIRRRLRQKLELLAEDVIALDAPTEEALQAYLDENAGDYRLEPRYSLRQIYFSTDYRDEDTAADARALLEQLRTGEVEDSDWESLGDRIALPAETRGARASALAARFGDRFAESLAGLEPGEWQGPVQSGFGLHLVYLDAVVEGRAVTLDEARDEVLRDYEAQRLRESIDTLYDRLRKRYEIVVEPLGARTDEVTGESTTESTQSP
jgi:hypothetical protein